MKQAFKRWKSSAGYGSKTIQEGNKENNNDDHKEKTYGIKHWGRFRIAPRIHIQVKNFMKRVLQR
eukprot:6178507-Pleurochrysis_carterae.AAC.4